MIEEDFKNGDYVLKDGHVVRIGYTNGIDLDKIKHELIHVKSIRLNTNILYKFGFSDTVKEIHVGENTLICSFFDLNVKFIPGCDNDIKMCMATEIEGKSGVKNYVDELQHEINLTQEITDNDL